MTVLAVGASRNSTTRYTLRIAADEAEVRSAQRLRHQVFAEELGATLRSPLAGHDIDSFDRYCDHLVVVDEDQGEVVGTYRMLPPTKAKACRRLYSDGEFDLGNLAPLRPALVETGRSCVHPDHRGGAVIGLMWAGLARYLQLTGHRWLAGCASIPISDGGVNAARVWRWASSRHLAPPRLRVTPHQPLPVGAPDTTAPVVVPPLLRGYLRLGAWVCGPPAHDPVFQTADLFVLLSLDRTDPRYLRHFLGDLNQRP